MPHGAACEAAPTAEEAWWGHNAEIVGEPGLNTPMTSKVDDTTPDAQRGHSVVGGTPTTQLPQEKVPPMATSPNEARQIKGATASTVATIGRATTDAKPQNTMPSAAEHEVSPDPMMLAPKRLDNGTMAQRRHSMVGVRPTMPLTWNGEEPLAWTTASGVEPTAEETAAAVALAERAARRTEEIPLHTAAYEAAMEVAEETRCVEAAELEFERDLDVSIASDVDEQWRLRLELSVEEARELVSTDLSTGSFDDQSGHWEAPHDSLATSSGCASASSLESFEEEEGSMSVWYHLLEKVTRLCYIIPP